MEASDRPLGPHEILLLAKRRHSGLGIATVYRNLKCLIEEGWLTEVVLPNESPRYERAGKHHHHHFQCLVCKGVSELHACASAIRKLPVPAGYEVERHELTLFGRCPNCR